MYIAIVQVDTRFAVWITCTPQQKHELIQKLLQVIGGSEYLHEHQCTIGGFPNLFVMVGARNRPSTEIDTIVYTRNLFMLQAVRLPDKCTDRLLFQQGDQQLQHPTPTTEFATNTHGWLATHDR